MTVDRSILSIEFKLLFNFVLFLIFIYTFFALSGTCFQMHACFYLTFMDSLREEGRGTRFGVVGHGCTVYNSSALDLFFLPVIVYVYNVDDHMIAG